MTSSNHDFADSDGDAVEQKKAADQAREEELELHRRLNLTPSMLSVIEPDGRYTWVNDVVLQYFGISAADITSDDLRRRVVHPDDFQRLREERQRILASGAPFEYENRLRRHDGQYRWFLVRYQPLKDAAGRVVRWYGGAIDIEDRKRAEEALRRSEAYLAEAQRLSHTGSWAYKVDAGDLVVRYWSEENFRIWGFDPLEGLPTTEMVRQRIHPEDRERAIAAAARVLRAETDYSSEFRIVLPDGAVRHILSLGHSIVRVDEDHMQMAGTHVDMTERKRAEEALRQTQAALAHVTRLTTMGEMTASIAHEINQPLSGVVSNGSACLRWLAGDAPNLEEARDAARRVVRDGKRAGAVIAQIRALAKKTDIAMARLDMNETIREILSLARDEVARNLVTTHLHLAADLSPVLGDRVQLQQVVLNLIMNGIEAMSSVEGRPRELAISTRNMEADQVTVKIQDSGVGLKPEDIDRIFASFYTTKSAGMGLGLSISRSIVQRHGGRLWATANDGPGTTFQFTVPKYYQESSVAV